ncbi:MAG: glycosyltransferase family 9 protein [Ferruginibacter sp.]
MKKILIIQTAFIGDVVLATAMVEKLHLFFPSAYIDFLVRKGNESLLNNNPFLHEVLIWDKKSNKNKNLFSVIKKVRGNKYDIVINAQRYFSTGLLTIFSGAKQTIGFNKNPLSVLFGKRINHVFDLQHKLHEVERNNELIKHLTDDTLIMPALYPSIGDIQFIQEYVNEPFITITPSSIWFTKKYPLDKWNDMIRKIPDSYNIYLLGGKENYEECEYILRNVSNKKIHILAGKLSFLQSSALMKKAKMNYVNDSAPMHFASATNAPVTAVYCSTIPAFGYTPLSDRSFIIETKEQLSCRPCGIHGRSSCPLGHFRCAYGIETSQLLVTINL